MDCNFEWSDETDTIILSEHISEIQFKYVPPSGEEEIELIYGELIPLDSKVKVYIKLKEDGSKFRKIHYISNDELFEILPLALEPNEDGFYIINVSIKGDTKLTVKLGNSFTVEKFIPTGENLDNVQISATIDGAFKDVNHTIQYTYGEDVVLNAIDYNGIYFDKWEEMTATDESENPIFSLLDDNMSVKITLTKTHHFRAKFSNKPIYQYISIVHKPYLYEQITPLKFRIHLNRNQKDIVQVYMLNRFDYERFMDVRYVIREGEYVAENEKPMTPEGVDPNVIYTPVSGDKAYFRILKNNYVSISGTQDRAGAIDLANVYVKSWSFCEAEECDVTGGWFDSKKNLHKIDTQLTQLEPLNKDILLTVSYNPYVKKPVTVNGGKVDPEQGEVEGEADVSQIYFTAKSLCAIAKPGYKFAGYFLYIDDNKIDVNIKSSFFDGKIDIREYSDLINNATNIEIVPEFEEEKFSFYSFDNGEENKVLEWRSKRFQNDPPFNMTSSQIYADDYPVELIVDMSSSPDKPIDKKQRASINLTNQNSRRLPMRRPEKFIEVEVKSNNPITDIKLSSSMGGLLNGNM